MPANDPNFTPLTMNEILDEELDAEYMGKVRKIVLSTGNTVWVECRDPYGFWYIRLSKGRMPDKMQGAYTTFQAALRDINLWLKDKREPIVYETNVRKPKKETEQPILE